MKVVVLERRECPMYGYLCHHCGHQEAAHAGMGPIDLPDGWRTKKLDGYPMTFSECPGLTYKEGEILLAQEEHEFFTGEKLSGERHPTPSDSESLPAEVADGTSF